ncbi:MAG: hypothetical protein UU93_C0012G0017 [Candidatus Amesbacteria bacterium GW2011_GWA2_42_12]|uniref:Uncharacterized protein n=1 Tax=Candidatus Amesbacteria bacterium GW2011_GWA2_42_12 TaxID=1618356 RepID=A0A0G1B372_9BACT|nr:MAG: hypothetical protein UU93_C0012G0017 [Candidatus Amesbacteria bacterium GW2011_GWA2_42_12]
MDVLLKKKAIGLRNIGESYSQISQELMVNKSTLSGWLKDIVLSDELKKKISSRRPQWIENYKRAVKIRNDLKMKNLIGKTKKDFGFLTKRDWEVAGAFLYWGEGEKGRGSAISVSNTNPDIILFAINWLEKCFDLDRSNMKFYLHLYSDMNIGEKVKYWCSYLDIKESQFGKPYIKKSTLLSIDFKSFKHGTCRLYYGDVKIKDRILSLVKLFVLSINSTGPVVQW